MPIKKKVIATPFVSQNPVRTQNLDWKWFNVYVQM